MTCRRGFGREIQALPLHWAPTQGPVRVTKGSNTQEHFWAALPGPLPYHPAIVPSSQSVTGKHGQHLLTTGHSFTAGHGLVAFSLLGHQLPPPLPWPSSQVSSQLLFPSGLVRKQNTGNQHKQTGLGCGTSGSIRSRSSLPSGLPQAFR